MLMNHERSSSLKFILLLVGELVLGVRLYLVAVELVGFRLYNILYLDLSIVLQRYRCM